MSRFVRSLRPWGQPASRTHWRCETVRPCGLGSRSRRRSSGGSDVRWLRGSDASPGRRQRTSPLCPLARGELRHRQIGSARTRDSNDRWRDRKQCCSRRAISAPTRLRFLRRRTTGGPRQEYGVVCPREPSTWSRCSTSFAPGKAARSCASPSSPGSSTPTTVNAAKVV